MDKSAIIAQLKQSPLFAELDDHYLELLADCGHTATHHAGDFIFDEGKAAKDLIMVLSGNITLSQTAGALGDLEVERLGPGAIVSWAWLIPPHRNWFSARANTKTQLLIFDGLCVRGKCIEDPQFGYTILQRILTVAADRLAHVRKRLNAECEGV